MSENQRQRQVEAGVNWGAATLLQIDRVRAVNLELVRQFHDEKWQQPNWDEAQHRDVWRRLEADRNFMLVAAYDLVRAVEFLNPPPHVDTTALDPIRSLAPKLKTLRDCVEHWDEQNVEWMTRKPSPKSGEAYRKLAELAADADMQHYTWSESGQHATVAGVLNLSELHDAATAAFDYFQGLSRSWSWVWDGWPPN